MNIIRECDIFNDDSAEIIEVEEEKPKDEQLEKLSQQIKNRLMCASGIKVR